ncbi:hypothetical protein [Dyadobacter sp. NIV53]|uniref:hypothetical protein n=1 Tax=Dyadobacter sp. NIV53 TaxID=2861765 RepID=UPI001C8547DB|nr:hypothetical protein [Dyadobacter sp. NIV53]
MKKNVIISCILAMLSQVVFGQLSEGSKINANTGTGFNTSKAGVFWNSPSPVSNTVGQFYLDSVWHEGNVKFSNVIQQIGGSSTDSLNNILIRYNVLNDQLEVLADKSKNDVRVIDGKHLKNFKVKSSENDISEYVNTGSFHSDKVSAGFFEKLVQGKLSLMKYYRAKTVKPNYNPGFGTGEKNTTVSVESDYYVVLDNKAEKISPGKSCCLRS